MRATDTTTTPSYNISLKQVTELLIKHFDIHEGIYDTSIEFQIGVGPVGPDPDNLLPGAVMAVSAIGLTPTAFHGKSTVDAAVVNPKKAKKQKAKS
ncbi:hypothetical protein A1507_15515 [Methylomonas koyamae]|uniref:Uncharacterized protein n=1 Tax=Methylomonas koyamae TaxID=702114 RepID=A0A177NAT3_9GAMM|nr:hypothetical protein [Methylomonas koyamae]OAI14210.1 hypothetical protein A1507_15515 [Methylomonas koyamae]